MVQWHKPLAAGLVVVALAVALGLSVAGGVDSLASETTIYVDAEAVGAENGTSWTDAFTDLQAGLDAASSGKVWVAAGTYTPTLKVGGTEERNRSFQLKNGVALYGGFDPSAGATEWEDRDWANHVTILSGDLAGDDGVGFTNNGENSYHVLYHPEGRDLDSTAILDGFTVSGGNANGEWPHDGGGGMYNDGSSPALAHCTFSGNSATYGGGMYNYDSSPALANCTFSGNSATYGGGMRNYGSSPALANCTFSGNSATYGGGMANSSSSPALTHCTFSNNSATDEGGGMYNRYSSSPVLANCTFSNNSATDEGGGMYNSSSSSPALTNCTFTGNSASQGGGMYDASSSPVLTNCIMWGDTGGEIANSYSSPEVDYSDIQGGCGSIPGNNCGEGNIDAAPLFVDPDNGDVHLQGCSPALDAGDNAAPNLPANDFEGDDRIINGTVDMGVDEADFVPPQTYSLAVAAAGGGSVTEPGEGTFLYGCGRVVFLVAAPEAGHRFLGWTGDAVDEAGSASTTIVMDGDKTITAHFAAGSVLFVDAGAEGEEDGTSWDDAYTCLQAGLSAATAGVDIWVAAGTYTPTLKVGGTEERNRSFQLVNGVALYGGFDPSAGATEWEDRDWANHVTILSGDLDGDDGPAFEDNDENSYHVLYHPVGTELDSTAILDGFTVSGGNAHGPHPHTGGGGMLNDDSSPALANCTFSGNSASSGGGMHNTSSSPALAHCTFSGNSASNGGGMYNRYSSSPALTNCTFSNNSATYNGGGMHNHNSSPALTNCTFSNNSATYNGGGMHNHNSSPALTNCTFTRNSAIYGGGGMRNINGSLPVLTNCILWGDTGGEMVNFGSSPEVGHSDIQGGCGSIPGNNCREGNIDADPLFVDPDSGDVHLQGCSPALDAGDNAAALPPFDFEGDDRIINGTVDMGVDEADFDPPQSYSLAVTAGAGGSVTEPGEGAFVYGCGRVVFLVAAPEAGHRFLGWTGDAVDEAGSASTTIVMDGDKTITAHFAAGSVLFVDAGAEGEEDGTSWDDAYTGLQAALSAATAGVDIWVAAGTYTPTATYGGAEERNRSFQLVNGVALYGGFNPSAGDVAWEDRDWANHVTILSGDLDADDGPGFANNEENSYHVLYHPVGTELDSTAILDGFTVSGGNAHGPWPHDRGGGMFNDDSSPALTNCTFSGNSAINYGGGMYNDNSSPALTRCTFSDNSATYGGGTYNDNSSPALAHCTFSSNSATYGGGMYNRSSSSPALTNCAFSSNSASSGGGMYNDSSSSPELTNCTFSSNSASSGGGMRNSSSSPTLTNCTFSSNSASSGGGMGNYSSSPELTNCVLWGDTGGEMANRDSSPEVAHSDMQGGCTSIPGNICGPGNIDLDPQFADPTSGDYHLGSGSPCVDAGNSAAPGLPLTDFEGDARILDGDGDGEARVDMGVDEVRLLYVDAVAGGANDGTSWDDAFTGLQAALAAARAGEEIWVAEGTYTPTAKVGGTDERNRSFQLVNGVALYGGFDPSVGDTRLEDRDPAGHVTILSGDLNGDDGPAFENNTENSFHVFYHPEGTDLDATATLDGFTISGGNANGGINHNDGGGMFNVYSSPALINCTFWGNSANFGGGISNLLSSPALSNCTIAGNQAGSGGGMRNMYSSPALTNCTIAGNSASTGGGMGNWDNASPSLTNCILWGDTGGEMVNSASAPQVAYSDIQGGCTSIPGNNCGDGNIADDPQFADPDHGDFHLGPGSPCIDAGDNAAPGLTLTDFEGDARIVDGDRDGTATVDMGVDEVLLRAYLPLVARHE